MKSTLVNARNRNVIGAVVASTCLLWPVDHASAAEFTAATATGGATPALYQSDFTCYASVTEYSPVSLSSSCSGSFPYSNNSAAYSGTFAARSNYSGIGASVYWTQTTTGNLEVPDTQSNIGSQATIFDQIVIRGGIGSGTLLIHIVMSGTNSAFGGARSVAELSTGGPGSFSGGVDVVSGPGRYTYSAPFYFDVATAFSFGLRAHLHGISNLLGGPRGGSSDYINSADFLPFTVLDSNGLPVPNATVVSTSGFQYPVDSDGDGVKDGVDLCPGTAPGAQVNANGCSEAQIDSDGDGVMNSDDRCPNTAPFAGVDQFGCSAAQRDSDGDGVVDSVDLCPGTPAGTPVNSSGCPVPQQTAVCDVNGDNFIDYRDIRLIIRGLGKPASGATDPRDANRNGRIDLADVAICTSKCRRVLCLPPK